MSTHDQFFMCLNHMDALLQLAKIISNGIQWYPMVSNNMQNKVFRYYLCPVPMTPPTFGSASDSDMAAHSPLTGEGPQCSVCPHLGSTHRCRCRRLYLWPC